MKVRGHIDAQPFESSFMALGDGPHTLPVKADVRTAIGKQSGDDAVAGAPGPGPLSEMTP